MNKPEYGSLHKFLVSLGLILLALPLVLLYFFTRTDFLLLTRAEYARLSDFSLHQLQQYDALMSQLETLFPVLCIVSLAGGIALLYRGIIGWAPVQDDLDRAIKADRLSRELKNKQMSSSEVLEKAAELLKQIEQTGLFATLEQGIFADIKRPRDGGKGLAGVCGKQDGYYNPFVDMMVSDLEGGNMA